MSYILDALRKADAQRQRDPARGIHAQPLGAAGIGSQARSNKGVRLWSAAGVGVVALSSVAWYLYRDGAAGAPAAVRQEHGGTAMRAPAPVTTLAQAQTAPVVGNTGVAPAAVASAPMPAPAINPAPVISPPAAPRQPFTPPAVDPRATSQPMMRGVPQSPPAMASAPGAPITARSPAAAQAPVTAVPPAAAPRLPAISAPVPAPPPTPPVSGLPPDAPKLVLSGGVYSTNPAQRMLIVNGQVFNEGSEVASGVALEEIKPRTVVLRFRGARYTVPY